MATKNQKSTRGRKPDASSKSGKIRELLATGMKPADIAKQVGCTPALVYNVKAKAAGGGGKKRGPGRPSKAAKASSVNHAGDGIAAILAAVKGSEQDRMRMRLALEKIQAVVADALA